MKWILVISVLILSGCGMVDQGVAHLKGHATECVDGVRYLIFPQSVTVKYTTEGKVEVCK